MTATTDELYQEQVRLEQRMAKLGVDKFRDAYERWTRTKRATDTKSVRIAMDKAIMPLVEAIDNFRRQAGENKVGRRHRVVRLLGNTDSPLLAFMTVKIVMDGLVRSQELVPLATRLANYLETEKNASTLGRHDAPMAKLIHATMKSTQKTNTSPTNIRSGLRHALLRNYTDVVEEQWESWSLTEKTQIGLKLIELLCQSTGLFEVKMKKKFKKTIAVVVPTPNFMEWLEKLNNQAELLFPEYLPCIIPPKDWTGLQDGGYHTQSFSYPINFIKTRSKAHRKALKEADLSAVFKAVNAMQRTSWTINARVLEVAYYLMDLGTGLAGLPNRVLDIPTKPHDIKTNEEARVAWSRAAGQIWRSNIESKMQRLQAWKTIKIAMEFRKYARLYFPYQLDFRGRVYSIPSHLTPQGTDLAKGLLQFSEGDVIADKQARDWLSIHGANCYGFDKVSFDERLQWVRDNERQILATATDPLDDLWWTEADSPFCFLAFCFEWGGLREAERCGETFISRLPVAMDGSCNGLQHYSAMLRDPKAGRAVNLVPSDTPQDIYGAVANQVNDKLQQAAKSFDEDNPEYQGWAQLWLEFGINRKITKRPVMVLPYGGTFSSCLDYVREAVMERGDYHLTDIVGKHEAIIYLAKLVWQSIDDVVVSARLAMKWLREVAHGYMERGEAVSWVTPLGLPVVQHYSEMQSIRIESVLFGKRFQPRIEIPKTDTPHQNRQINGFAPNFVHSLDTCAMMMTINKAVDRGLNHFAMIHDSYGTTAAKSAQLATILRQEFIKLYETDSPLNQFEAAKDPPFVGGLELKQVESSPYFFA